MRNGKNRAPKREATVIFSGKLSSAIGTATVLIAKLQAMQRHKAVRSDAEARARYTKFISVLSEQVASLAPKDSVEASGGPFDSV